MKSFTIKEIHAIVGGELFGETAQSITGPEEIQQAKEHHITFIGNQKYKKLWEISSACAAIVNKNIDLEIVPNKAFIKVKNADLAMAKILDAFAPEEIEFETAIHPTAIIHPSAKIGAQVKIGAGCFVGKEVQLGDQVILYPNVSVFDAVHIGAQTVIWSGTVLRERTEIGAQCIIHSNVNIGTDGFGYRPSEDGKSLVKIVHIGNVIIGNQVEIGAGTCIDRGKFSATFIDDGCKIDNMVQIAHNCKMGKCCIMAGSSGLAGSVTLGNGVIIGGDVSVKDHIVLGDGVIVGGGSSVMSDFPAGATILGYPAANSREKLKEWVAIRRLVKG
jgi:UDP-3-O-[3-hydroxymyristoyl] glucosamine N-acyltransferase